MTCDACELAARGVTGLFSRDRKCCQARAIARSPYFAESLRSGRQTRMYRDALEAFGVTHEQVIEAARADRECDSIVERMEKRVRYSVTTPLERPVRSRIWSAT